MRQDRGRRSRDYDDDYDDDDDVKNPHNKPVKKAPRYSLVRFKKGFIIGERTGKTGMLYRDSENFWMNDKTNAMRPMSSKDANAIIRELIEEDYKKAKMVR
jgi:hypothetical protein